MKRLAAIVLAAAMLSGCSFLQSHGLIKSGNVTVAGVKDAGKPATLATDEKRESIPIPAGSTVTVKETPAVAATATTPYRPAEKITEFRFNGSTEWQKFEGYVLANTGTVDTSVAEKRIDAQESRPLLYAAILSALAAGFFVYRAYPTAAFICAGAAVVFMVAWKASGLPEWFWAVGAIALAAAAFLYIGHERGTATAAPPLSNQNK